MRLGVDPGEGPQLLDSRAGAGVVGDLEDEAGAWTPVIIYIYIIFIYCVKYYIIQRSR